MSTYLCLDPGLKHTGVAISYEGSLSVPLTTFHTDNLQTLTAKIISLIERHHPSLLLIGIPEHGPANALARDLKARLESKTETEIQFVDEYLSTRSANEAHIASKTSLFKRKQNQHQASAAAILQQFLDNQ